MNFEAFGLDPAVAAGVVLAGYQSPTPIQAQAIPKVMTGKDVMGLAQTGTGKTAAFALPILNRLIQGKSGGVRALVVAPTRELAEQIHQAFVVLGKNTGLRSATVYGGVGMNPQIEALKKADIIVACPGRLLDHLGRISGALAKVEVLVLDEADQMFDMGFFPDIRRILKHLPKQRQTLLFSATMPSEIRKLADEVLHQPVTIQVGSGNTTAETVSHTMFPVSKHLKTALLLRLLKESDPKSVLVFTRTKYAARNLGDKLSKAGYKSASLQGNLSQARRQAALGGFREGEYQILVATDIAARGIDVTLVSHVINFDVPTTPEAYIHRIGRTGRAERSGEAFTFVTEEDLSMARAIDRAVGTPVERRTLPDFDYHAPRPANSDPVERPDRRPMPSRAGDKRAPSPRTGERRPAQARPTDRRERKGAFTRMPSRSN